MKAVLSAVILCAATLLAGCGGNSNNNPNGNPLATSIYVTQNGNLSSGVQVTLSTGISGAGTPTGIIAQQNTNSGGVANFNTLPGTGQLCVYAALAVANFKSYCAQPFPETYTLAF
ncbi:MAG: hypothetical protein ACLPYS_15980 [Vulcanimicrobiaceae bacterium]